MYCKKMKKTLRRDLKREARAMFMIELMLMKNLMSQGKKTKLTVQFMLILLKHT